MQFDRSCFTWGIYKRTLQKFNQDNITFIARVCEESRSVAVNDSIERLCLRALDDCVREFLNLLPIIWEREKCIWGLPILRLIQFGCFFLGHVFNRPNCNNEQLVWKAKTFLKMDTIIVQNLKLDQHARHVSHCTFPIGY